MRRFRPVFILALVLVWLNPGLVSAQPTLHGELSGSLGPGTYIVDGDCQIIYGQTLTIIPGTEFLFNGHHTWNIYGTLIAVGTEDSLIQFLRQMPYENYRWGGLRFQAGASNESILDYCIIDNCKNLTSPNYNGGGIFSNGVGVTINNTRITACKATSGGGIYTTNYANIILDNSIVAKCEAGNGGGVYLINCPNAQVMNSIIFRNKSTST